MTMLSPNLRAALEDARRHLASAVQQQNYWSFEVNRLQNLVRTMAANVLNAERNEQIQREMQYQLSITLAIEGLVNTSPNPLSAVEVIERLRGASYDIDRYANPNALVHQTLRRLAQAQRIKELRVGFMRNDFNQWLFR